MHVLDVNEIFGMTFYTYDRIMESGNSDALVLYIKYLKQSRMQDTSKTFSLDEFMWKGMGWGHDRFYKAKKVLKELGLIDIIKTMGPDGKFIDNFVRVNYLVDENRIRTLGSTYELIQSPGNPKSGKQGEEMLININKNNINKNSKNSRKSNNTIEDDKTNLLNGKEPYANKDVCARVESYDDIQSVIEDDSYRIDNNKLLKCIVKMCELGYNVDKKERQIRELVEWIKEKAEIYNIKNSDGTIAQGTMLQIFDQWCEYWKSKGKVTNHKNSVMRFMINYNKYKK